MAGRPKEEASVKIQFRVKKSQETKWRLYLHEGKEYVKNIYKYLKMSEETEKLMNMAVDAYLFEKSKSGELNGSDCIDCFTELSKKLSEITKDRMDNLI